MATALINGRIFTGDDIVDGCHVIIDDAEIISVSTPDKTPSGVDTYDLHGALLAPGFVDTQVNGGGGYLFNDAPTVETVRKIGQTHRQFGTTGFLPTLISDDLHIIEAAIAAVDLAISEGVPGVLGIHIEGPFLNTDRKGVHNPGKFRRLEASHIELLSSLQHGKTLVTLAPENAAPELITQLSNNGVIVSAGHTNATYTMAREAINAGITGFTHLFNAMSPVTSREPGVVGAALEDQESWCGIIVDGRHVAPTSLRIALRCKPIDKFMLVTDAMPTVGWSDDCFTLQGRKITVEDGACVSENGTLAGSNLDMSQAVRNAVSMLDVDYGQAINMASLNPAAFLGLDSEIGCIAPGYRANLVALNNKMEVVESWIDGVQFNAAALDDASAEPIARSLTNRR